MDTNILLESGTNELEILEFKVGQNHYGINVEKIREILPFQNPTPIPNAHSHIEGIFMPRDMILSVIDLGACIGFPQGRNADKTSDMFIITNFNKLSTAFHVSSVLGIHRVSWTEIVKPDSTINSNEASVATGIMRLEDRLIVILDFEKILSEINPESALKYTEIDQMEGRKRSDSPIIMAEDSPMLSKMIFNCLTKAGYNHIIVTDNGQECWDKLQKYKEEGTIDEKISCVITDIEMPQMDGHRLTKLVKEDEELKHLPIVIFSSLINDQMRIKGERLGAYAQLTKPEIGQLVEAIDRLLEQRALKKIS